MVISSVTPHKLRTASVALPRTEHEQCGSAGCSTSTALPSSDVDYAASAWRGFTKASDRHPSRGWGMGRYSPPHPTIGGLWECRNIPQRSPGQSPNEKKTILLLSKRVRTPLIATFVEINVVHSRPLIEKKWVCSMDPLRQLRR